MKGLIQHLNEELILERFVNCKNKEEMEKYKDVVFKMLQDSYKDLPGGCAGMDNADQLVKESDFWKIRKKDGKILAVMCYTFKRGGRKACYGGTNGTKEGVQALKDMVADDIRLSDREAWAEVSDSMEHIYLKRGAVPIPAEVAKQVMKDKKFLKINPDGYHYTREIGGEPHEKLLVANVTGIKNFKNLDEKDAE